MGKGILSLVSAAGTSGDETVSPETILFNELEITNVNFFADSSSDSFASKLKTNIASWYYVMRTIAIIASVCVLLYIGIRMATSTIASEEAEYKRMLTDWLVGFALIFLLHYIIILVINGNDVIVRALKTTMESSSGQLTSFLDKISDQIGWAQEISKTLSATFVYLILVGITLAFLLMYIKRMIVVAFLIIIAPLITITYAIDKVKDKESQALNSWIKEFFWTVLIQPFHCVIYVVFVSVAVSSLDEATLSSAILAIMCMIFILQAEDIIKKIFGIQADNIGKMSSSFAVAAGATLMAQKFAGKASGKVASGVAKAADAGLKALPKLQDTVGAGTNPTGRSNDFSQKVANAMGSGPVQKSLDKFNDFMDNNFLGKATKKYYDWGISGASTLVGTALTVPTSNGVEGIAAGTAAGLAVGRAVKSGIRWAATTPTTRIIEAGRDKNAAENLTQSYKQMQRETGFNQQQMQEKAKLYLKLDLNSELAKKLGDTEKLFAYNLQVMKQRLEKAGLDTSVETVMSKINLKDMNDNNTNNNNNSNGSTRA